MAIIWGFDLSRMRWNAFQHANMFDKGWNLRRQRFIVYQLAMLLGLIAECIATYSLSKYEDQQTNIERLSGHTARVHNNNLIDSAIVTIVFCVLVATIFGAEFFFLLFWPERTYPSWYDRTRKLLAVVITLGMAIAAFTSTIIVARQSASITGVDSSTAQQYLDVYSRPSFVYRRFGQNIAWVALIWPAFLATVASTYIMFKASAYDRQYGTSRRIATDKDAESFQAPNRNSHENLTDGNEKTTRENISSRNVEHHSSIANGDPAVTPPLAPGHHAHV